MIKNLPNALTLANLFCGCLAVVAILHGNLSAGAVLIGISLLLDWLDGTAARYCKMASPLGRELDSMADMVSFGVVPGVILYHILEQSRMVGLDNLLTVANQPTGFSWAAAPAFLLSAFSGLRLAKFNLDTRQTDSFIGLNTPACTIFMLGLGLAWEANIFGLKPFLSQSWLIFGIVGLFSYLLVSEIPMYSLKVKQGRGPLIFGAILAAAALIFFLKGLGLSVLIGVYIVSSILFFRNK